MRKRNSYYLYYVPINATLAGTELVAFFTPKGGFGFVVVAVAYDREEMAEASSRVYLDLRRVFEIGLRHDFVE